MRLAIALLIGVACCCCLAADRRPNNDNDNDIHRQTELLKSWQKRYVNDDTSWQIRHHMTGDPTERTFAFVTDDQITPVLNLGLSPDNLNMTFTGTSAYFDPAGEYINNVYVTGLQLDTTYYYQVGADSEGWSSTYSFATITNRPLVYAVYGDFGLTNDVSLDQLLADRKAGVYDAVLHVGDIAYNLDSQSGSVGDSFLSGIQPISATVPYMLLPGNHEMYHNFTDYLNRFTALKIGAGANSNSNTNLFYSFDEGITHFVVIDTEVYAYSSDPGQIQRQLNWLQKDLDAANANRDAVPWLVVLSHKCEWMDNTDFSSFTPMLHSAGVDVQFCGHQHNYQRNLPYNGNNIDKQTSNHTYTNPLYMVRLVVGSPGCDEYVSHGLNSASKLMYHSFNYGYGQMIIANQTHLLWQWTKTGSGIAGSNDVEDELTLVQHKHGPRLYQ